MSDAPLTPAEQLARERYILAVRRMQTGVAYDPDGQILEPKHCRVGINSGMVDHASLASLLISKGVITRAEYYSALATGMEAEVKRYEDDLAEKLGTRITLGPAGIDHDHPLES